MTDESPQPSPARIARRLVAEFLGTGLLVAIVVGSGIAASQLSPEAIGLQLLENSLATTLGLAVLIAVLAQVSGAHFNPVVSLADWWLGRRSGRSSFAVRDVTPYAAAQVLGAIAGALLANAMFDVPTAIATTERATPSTLLAEVVATAGLVLVIFALVRSGNTRIIPAAVGAYIGAAYWFTSSTSFANPAVTIGRVFLGHLRRHLANVSPPVHRRADRRRSPWNRAGRLPLPSACRGDGARWEQGSRRSSQMIDDGLLFSHEH